jgi:DNA-binding MarR family transcriptional regulator
VLSNRRYLGGWLEPWRVAEAAGLTAPLAHAALRRLERAGLAERRRTGRGVEWRAT